MKPQRSLVPIGSFLQSYFEKKGWASQLQEYRIFTQWESIVGKDLSRRCQPIVLRNTILTIQVSNSSWLTQLQFMKSQLIEKIRVVLHIPLKDIYFKIGFVKTPQEKTIVQASFSKTDNTYMLSDTWQMAEKHLKDSELRQIIENIFKKHYQSGK